MRRSVRAAVRLKPTYFSSSSFFLLFIIFYSTIFILFLLPKQSYFNLILFIFSFYGLLQLLYLFINVLLLLRFFRISIGPVFTHFFLSSTSSPFGSVCRLLTFVSHLLISGSDSGVILFCFVPRALVSPCLPLALLHPTQLDCFCCSDLVASSKAESLLLLLSSYHFLPLLWCHFKTIIMQRQRWMHRNSGRKG